MEIYVTPGIDNIEDFIFKKGSKIELKCMNEECEHIESFDIPNFFNYSQIESTMNNWVSG